MAARNSDKLDKERRKYRALITTALTEDEDPLAAYEQFVQWTVKTYGMEDPNSGLLDLLEETTRQFKDDDGYKGNRRYLDLWVMYAKLVEDPVTVYSFLVENGIGSAFCLLYEEYARVLERDGLGSEAERMYHLGIERRARPVEKLKKLYQEFKSRQPSASARVSTTNPSAASKARPSSSAAKPSSSEDPAPPPLPNVAPPTDGYARIKGPVVAGKRREKLRLDLSLLMTDEGIEYSNAEARARSLGLLGKKWASLSVPPPAPQVVPKVPVNSNDGGQKTTTTRRKAMMVGEPTVTINTKQALADVFGMFNSPEKTMRSSQAPGSKHAPVKKVEPVTPVVRVSQTPRAQPQHEKGGLTKTPGSAFRPFVDDNNVRKENGQSASTPFKPFTDPDLHEKHPFVTPDPNRRALSLKDVTTPTAAPRGNSSENAPSALKPKPLKPALDENNAFSKVFTPKSICQPSSLDEVRQIPQDVVSPCLPMRPLDVVEPSKPLDVVEPSEIAAASLRRVFSRPGENSFVPKRGASFTPFVDTATEPPPSGSKPRFALADRTPSKPLLSDDDADDDDAGDDEAEEEEAMHEYDYQEAPPQESTDEDDYHEAAEHELEQYRVPLGGRFGQFNVMTPITERTYEFTTSTRAAMTPNDDSSPFLRHEHDALLTAELREEEEREQALSLARVSFDPERRRHSCQSEGREALDSSFTSEGGEGPLPALPIVHGDDETGVLDPSLGVAALEQRTATLSLEDALAVKLAFKPPNPCNPFDPPIVTTLLSVMPSERGFHDLRDREAKLLDGLNKFADKRRKLSGNGTANLTLDLAQSCSVTLGDRRFAVLDKLGEGGFGSVFAAKERSRVRDLGGSDDDEDDEDEDDEGTSSMIALKVVRPRNVWEYHVLRRLHAALPPHLRKSVVVPHALYAFRDESFLILDFCSQGTLLNVVNHASQAGVSQQGACLDEMLVIFFTVELLRLLEGMHSVGFVHGDLKIDNCLLRLEDVPGGSAAWANVYQPSGVGGWSRKGIKLIDFGRTIDTALFPRGQTFVAEWAVDARDCPEMREDRPWTYQPDYFGLAGVVYCMLFGKYIEAASVTRQSDGRLRLSTPFKRYWQSDMWTRLFDLLLNPCLVRAGGELPLCRELRELREGMEGWLESNSNRTGNTLKALLKKVERSVL